MRRSEERATHQVISFLLVIYSCFLVTTEIAKLPRAIRSEFDLTSHLGADIPDETFRVF